MIAGILRACGVPGDAIDLEERSTNTAQQAAAVAELVPGPVIVVTDAYHLPRAVFLMRRRGLDATGSGAGRGGGSLVRWVAGALREIPAFAKDAVFELAGRR